MADGVRSYPRHGVVRPPAPDSTHAGGRRIIDAAMRLHRTKIRPRAVAALLGVLSIAASASAGPLARNDRAPTQLDQLGRRMQGRTVYLCCTLRFNRDGSATDANLRYVFEDSILPAGTPVSVDVVSRASTGSRAPAVRLRPTGTQRDFTLRFVYGGGRSDAADYFEKILLETNPGATIRSQPHEIRSAIAKGRLRIGMTREQALLARGYPPAHQTSTIASDEWIYYVTNGAIEAVRFEGGRIADIEMGPAP